MAVFRVSAGIESTAASLKGPPAERKKNPAPQ